MAIGGALHFLTPPQLPTLAGQPRIRLEATSRSREHLGSFANALEQSFERASEVVIVQVGLANDASKYDISPAGLVLGWQNRRADRPN